MAVFAYQAVDRFGRASDGTMQAPTEVQLEFDLRSIGLWLVNAQPADRRRQRRSSRVARRDLADLYHGLASLLGAGLSIAESFRAMHDEVEDPMLRQIVEDIERHVETGNQVSDALKNYPRVFPENVCNIVAAGEHSGNLPQTFSDLARHTEWVDGIVSDIKQASIYPAAILSAVAGLIVLLLVVVVPRFAEVFNELNLQLPLITRLLIGLGDAASSYWWAFLLLLLALAGLIRFGPMYNEQLREYFDRARLRLPVFGPVNRMLVQSQLTHNLSLLLRAGVPILDSLRLCRNLVGNSIMRQAIEAAELAVSEGRRASDSFRQYDVVSSLTLRMFVLGEETGNLDNCLEHVTRRFDEEIPRRIKRIFSVLEPVITVVLVAIVGLVAASLFLPMFSLIGGIGK